MIKINNDFLNIVNDILENPKFKELKNIMSGYRNNERFYKRMTLIQNSKKG